MGIIHTLSEATAQRIRAGEVIDRPAALLKELLENAIDAAAKRIEVELSRDGGAERMVVVDDGHGMAADDLEACIGRHATSKLRDEAELPLILTLGFRGEALAAAATFAELHITSRPPQGEAHRIHCRDGRHVLGGAVPASGAVGTRVESLGLFSTHRARLEFMGKASAELAHSRRVIENAALAHPDVSFRLTVEGKQVLCLQAGQGDERILATLGQEFWENSVPVEADEQGLTVRGRIGKATWKGNARSGLRVAVNGRCLTGLGILQSAMEEAYADLAPRKIGFHGLLLIDCDTRQVDPNIHPAKAEIRFRQPTRLQARLRDGLRQALRGSLPLAAHALAAQALQAFQPVVAVVTDEGDRRRLPLGRATGLVLGGYIVAETMHSMVLVDAHAAHERLIYEELKAALRAGTALQPCLLDTPIIVDLGTEAVAAFEQQEEAMASMGIVGHALDDETLVLSAIPAFVAPSEAAQMMRDTANALVNGSGSTLLDRLDAACSSVACKAAFRFGDSLEDSQRFADDLLRRMEATPASAQCNHGRPTSIELGKERLSSLFGR